MKIPGKIMRTLRPTENGTRVIQHEEYRGISIWFWDYSWVEPTYQKANEALKNRVINLKNALPASG
ncbi:MAG: hypothetical protein AB2552_21490 [Candidatus Thiodiazotropha endolucinida]